MERAVLSDDGEHSLSEAECLTQLQRILSSPDFEATAREHRFLDYVVKESLSGRGSRIKAYSIAVEVFGRDASFDPQSDPIVRIEASRLRRSLERYYLTSGSADSISISIPKGGYVPDFSRASPAMPAPAAAVAAPTTSPPPRARWMWPFALLCAFAILGACLGLWQTLGGKPALSPEIPRLLVEPFENLSRTDVSAAIADGLTQEVTGQLSRFKDIIVMTSVPENVEASALPRFSLSGSVNLGDDAFRVRVRLTNRSDGSVLWANSYDGEVRVADLLEAEADISRNVATSLAQTYGVIFQADAAVHVKDAPDDWAAYSCTLSYYAYRARLDPQENLAVRACLEKAVERFPNYATAWALLSQTYIDGVRFTFPFEPGTQRATVARALEAAQRAVELDPLNIRGLQAEMFALYFSKEIDSALAVGKQALAINPNDTELMGEYGYRLALSGDWVAGCPLVEEARARNPGPFAYYETALALCSYFRGDQSRAATWIRKANVASNNPSYHAIAAAIYAESGDREAASRERDWLTTHVPALVKNVRREVSERFARNADVETFIASLRKAGFSIE